MPRGVNPSCGTATSAARNSPPRPQEPVPGVRGGRRAPQAQLQPPARLQPAGGARIHLGPIPPAAASARRFGGGAWGRTDRAMSQNAGMLSRRPAKQPPLCGRPSLIDGRPPCPRPREIGEGCRYHATAEERAAHQQEEARAEISRDPATKAERRKQAEVRERRLAVGCYTVLALAALGGLGSWRWSSLQYSHHEAVCRPHLEQANDLNEKARAISVPLVSPLDPAVATLQLGNRTEVPSTSATFVGPDQVADIYHDRWVAANQAADEVLDHGDCSSEPMRERADRIRNAPASVTSVTMPEPARCADGWPSQSIGRQGACSHHGGVLPASPWAVLNF